MAQLKDYFTNPSRSVWTTANELPEEFQRRARLQCADYVLRTADSDTSREVLQDELAFYLDILGLVPLEDAAGDEI